MEVFTDAINLTHHGRVVSREDAREPLGK